MYYLCWPRGLPVHIALLMGFSTVDSLRSGVSVSAEQLRLLLSSCQYMLQDDGKQLPGRKGISVPQEQFCKLEQHAQKLTAALRNQRLGFTALSNK